MKLESFRLPKNKRFNYTPRYYEEKERGSTFEMGPRIREDRETVSNHFTKQWRSIHSEGRNKKNTQFSKTLWIVLVILVLLSLYLLSFDLSISLRK